MARKQAKTTQLQPNMMTLHHKSPMTPKNNLEALKPKMMTPPTKQTMQSAPSDSQAASQEADEEMIDNASTATRHITNALIPATMQKPNSTNKKNSSKTILNPWKTILAGKTNNITQQGEMRAKTKDPPLKSHCQIKWWNQSTGKGVKAVHQQKILSILDQLQKANATMTVFWFYSTDKNASTQAYPLLQGKVKLPPDPAGMRQYCLGQPPLEHPGYTLILIYLGHIKTLAKSLVQTNIWMTDKQVLILLTAIPEEKVQEICWLLYTTKQSNC